MSVEVERHEEQGDAVLDESFKLKVIINPNLLSINV